MSAVRTAAGALLRSRDRATSVLTVAAFALPHAFLLAVTGGVMAFGARAAVAATSATGDDPSSLDGMAPFYVMLAYFAATLLIVPIISMGAVAARLGMSRRERDLAVLRLVGLAPGKTKLACILETCVFAAVGVVVGSILYAVTLPAWGLTLHCGKPVPADIRQAGIRARHVMTVPEGTPDAFYCTVERVIQDVFTTIVLLRPEGAASGAPLLRMELERDDWRRLNRPEGLWIAVQPRDILLLK